MSGRGSIAGRLSPLVLRVVLAVTLLWAGLGKFIDTMPVRGENAAILANAGVIKGPSTPGGAAPPVIEDEEEPEPEPAAPVVEDPPPSVEPEPEPEADPEPTPPDADPGPAVDPEPEEEPVPDVEPEPEPDVPSTDPADEPLAPDAPLPTPDVPEDVPSEDPPSEPDPEPEPPAEPSFVLASHVTLVSDSEDGERAPWHTFSAEDFPEDVRVRKLHALTIRLYRAGYPSGGTHQAIVPEALARGSAPKWFSLGATSGVVLAGVLLLAGLFTRVAAFATLSVMGGVLWMSHFGPAMQSGDAVLGIIPNLPLWDLDAWRPLLWQLSLGAMALSVLLSGAGALAFDNGLFGPRYGGDDLFDDDL